MSIKVKDTSTPTTPAPEGLFQAVCVDVVELGLVDTQWGKKEKVYLAWQIDQVNPETRKRFTVMKRYTPSLSQKANLRKDLETWRGKKFSKEELEGFDLEILLGVNCQLQIAHNLADDGTCYANVQAIVPCGAGMTKLRPENYTRQCDRDKQTEEPEPATNGKAAF